MTDHNLLESHREEGTPVTVEEVHQENRHGAYVDDDGIIRAEENGAAFNADNYIIIHYGKSN